MPPRGQRVQLHRALSKLGAGSRKQAWQWIRAGEVTVDGRVVSDPLTWVDVRAQTIERRGRSLASPARLVLALHKPRGVVTTRSDERGRKTVYDLLPGDLPWIFPAGRLDADSEGLLILTNDARLAERLTDPEHHVAKTYRVTVTGSPAETDLERLRRGIPLDGLTRPATIDVVAHRGPLTDLDVILREGKNRQIRRMFAAIGHEVVRLVRTHVGAVALGDLAAGAHRTLSAPEIAALARAPRRSRHGAGAPGRPGAPFPGTGP